MFHYVWPIALVVLSNIAYQICAKSVPGGMNPFASLMITYGAGILCAAAMYFISSQGGSLVQELRKANWVPFVFGVVLVGLETGWIYAYKAGWQVSRASIVQSAFLAAALLIVGRLLYKEALTWNKCIGALICLVGLAFIQHN